MDGLSLLKEARTVGLSVHVDGDRLVIRGPSSGYLDTRRLILPGHHFTLCLRYSFAADFSGTSFPFAFS